MMMVEVEVELKVLRMREEELVKVKTDVEVEKRDNKIDTIRRSTIASYSMFKIIAIFISGLQYQRCS